MELESRVEAFVRQHGIFTPGSRIVIACSGGPDSLALADALNSGHLAGASVDVTDPEPLPADHPLWNARNILVTPHISGGDHLYETVERIVGIAADNLNRFVNGLELHNIVDPDAGYRRFVE